MQLFLLHFAGGSYYSYDFLKKSISSTVEFIPLELPGRGKRLQEPLLKDKKTAIEDYFRQIRKFRNNKPYLIYGHSMGATIGLSLANCMEKAGDAPKMLNVSGNAGPGIQKDDKRIHHLLNDTDFKASLRKLGGIPEEILSNEELYAFFNPIMRADFETLEKDNFMEIGIKLRTPIYALMGSEEKEKEKIENWKNFTSGGFQFKIVPGNHFFIQDHGQEITNIIQCCLKTEE